jgi:hypothetical protein
MAWYLKTGTALPYHITTQCHTPGRYDVTHNNFLLHEIDNMFSIMSLIQIILLFGYFLPFSFVLMIDETKQKMG